MQHISITLHFQDVAVHLLHQLCKLKSDNIFLACLSELLIIRFS